MNLHEFVNRMIQSDKTPMDVKVFLKGLLDQFCAEKDHEIPGEEPVPPTPAPEPPSPPVPPVPPVPPKPPEPPVPGAGWLVSMFFKLKGGVPWTGNQGSDSLLDFAGIHGRAWEDQCRKSGYASVRENGGNGVLWISELGNLINNVELQMFLCNREHPDKPGYFIPDKENLVQIAKNDYGITHWIISLFNDENGSIGKGQWEHYISEIVGKAFSWAGPGEVAFMTCLESNERFSVDEVVQIVKLIQKYANGKRVLVGSADPGYLKAVAVRTDKAVELWMETPHHPFALTNASADAFVQAGKDLRAQTGHPVWAGEYGRGYGSEAAYCSRKALEAGLGVGSYVKG